MSCLSAAHTALLRFNQLLYCLCILFLCFFLGVSVIVDRVCNGNDDQYPDEQADRSGEEHTKTSVCCGYCLDEVVLKVLTKDETD